MPLVAYDLFTLVMQDLDDETAIRTTPSAIFLRHATRAQQWVALRYRLLRETVPFPLFANTPLYNLPTRQPRIVVVTHITPSNGTVMWPIPMSSLRYRDTAWFATTGAPTAFYRVGWHYVGISPIPTTAETALLSGLVIPPELVESTTPLQVPEAWMPNVVLVTAGLMMLSRERRYQEGIARIMRGLGLQASGVAGGTSQRSREVAGVAG